MSLSIQVIASDGSAIPTMVFDEVDSGVGGGVAEMVGRRLQEIGANRQVLCVTHLPQVASLADQHFRISKVTDGKSTRTGLHVLGKDERIEELARMLGGVEITRRRWSTPRKCWLARDKSAPDQLVGWCFLRSSRTARGCDPAARSRAFPRFRAAFSRFRRS